MSLRSDAIDLADRVTTSALHELRLAINDARKDYRERACWRASFHTTMVRELTLELSQRHRQGRPAGLLPVRLGWHENHRLISIAECEANDVENQLMAICMSKLAEAK